MVLRSGRWKWSIHPQANHALVEVVYRHEARPEDQMAAWVPRLELTEERIRIAALDPDLRLWEEPEGRTWRVRCEIPFLHPGAGVESSRNLRVLAYYSDERRLETCVAADVRLGDLTGDELLRLLKTAASFPWD